MNRLIKKMSIQCEQDVIQVDFINSFQYKNSLEALTSYMIYTLNRENTIRIYDNTGYLMVDEYETGHDVITTMTSQREEIIIATLGRDQTIRVAKLDNKRI